MNRFSTLCSLIITLHLVQHTDAAVQELEHFSLTELEALVAETELHSNSLALSQVKVVSQPVSVLLKNRLDFAFLPSGQADAKGTLSTASEIDREGNSLSELLSGQKLVGHDYHTTATKAFTGNSRANNSDLGNLPNHSAGTPIFSCISPRAP